MWKAHHDFPGARALVEASILALGEFELIKEADIQANDQHNTDLDQDLCDIHVLKGTSCLT